MPSTAQLDNKPKRQLTLFDSTCIIVGIIIGAGIYKTGPFIASNTSGVGSLMAVWAIGGLIALLGALCYAELATAYPRAGGDYVYLTLAYGRRTGFLFAWAEFWILRPGNVGMLAFVFATYARELFPLRFLANHPQFELIFYAASAVALLSAMKRGPDGALVFAERSTQGVRVAIRRACREIELPLLRTHDLRHVAASHLVQAGVPAPTVARVLGHSDGGVLVMQRYGRWMPADAAQVAMERMAAWRDQPTARLTTQGT